MDQRIVDFEREFGRGHRDILRLCRKLQEELPTKFRGRIVSQAISSRDINDWAEACYGVIGETLYKALRIMQPGDFDHGPVNFYFLPGYHSYITRTRLFRRIEDAGSGERWADVGVGLCGEERFGKCCHIEWYRRVVRRSADGFRPASLYYWVMKQEPKTRGKDPLPLESFTMTTDAATSYGCPEHLVLSLDGQGKDSQHWGEQLCSLFDGLSCNAPEWKLPARPEEAGFDGEKEAFLRRTRCLLLSLWMTSVFCSQRPGWWEALLEDLKTGGVGLLAESLEQALAEKPACDWGDQSTGRPRFITSTTLVLGPLVAPPPDLLIEQRSRTAFPGKSGDPYEAARHIGWATLLCSAPLQLPFVIVARRWLGMIYAIMRNSEISICSNDLARQAKASQDTGFLFHDLHRYIINAQLKLNSEAHLATPEAIEYRHYAMGTINSLSTMVFAVGGAGVNPARRAQIRKEFLGSLKLPQRRLEQILQRAAWDVQNLADKADWKVDLHLDPENPEIRGDEMGAYTAALILTGELIRNQLVNGPSDQKATWRAEVRDNELSITFVSKSAAPIRSHTVACLNNFLTILEVGRATSDWNQGAGTMTWRVSVSLPDKDVK